MGRKSIERGRPNPISKKELRELAMARRSADLRASIVDHAITLLNITLTSRRDRGFFADRRPRGTHDNAVREAHEVDVEDDSSAENETINTASD
jgi:hypothetical protein